MQYWTKKEEAKRSDSGHGHWAYPMLDESNGCTNECATGISYYAQTEYTPVATHPFQEGFLVLSGKGWAKVGDKEFPIEGGISFVVPAEMAHQLKSDDADTPLELFWFHAAK